MMSRQVTGLPSVAYQYDPAGNLTQAAMPQATVNLTYDARNLLSTLGRSNGVSSTITRDALARVLSIAHQAGSNVLASFSYGYDPAGNRSSLATGLAQALTTPAATGTFDAANEATGFGSQSFTYDANGNRLTESGSGGTTTYTWDGRNRLKSVAQPNGVTTQFTYDFNRNLIQQAVTNNGTSSTSSYLLDQVTNVAAIFGPGPAILSLLTGVAPDSHYATVSGQAEFSLNDAVASVVGTSGVSSALDGTNLFEPFGQTTSSGVSFPFAFTGRPPFAGSSVYYYRSRYYDPAAGRFLSEDNARFAFAADLNLYRYLNNSPLSSSDPLGVSRAPGLFGGLGGWWPAHVSFAGDGSHNPQGGLAIGGLVIGGLRLVPQGQGLQ
jgi:RHS repeat-associated protein